MEPLKSVSSLEIPSNKIFYDKKTDVFSAEVLGFMFVGTYKKSTRINKILDDIFASLKEIQLNRNDLHIIDFVTNTKIHENTKLKNLKLLKKQKPEKKEEKPKEIQKIKDADKDFLYEIEEEEAFDEDIAVLSSITDDVKYKEEVYEEEKFLKRDERESRGSRRMKKAPKAKKKLPASELQPSPAPPEAISTPAKGLAPAAPPPPPSDGLTAPSTPAPKPTAEPSIVIPEEPQQTVYEINMGLQYYSVMMEQRSYLFYVYFSHKELKIVDEEGKTIYETTITIVTTKEEPPVLDLKIEGEGFEVHPIFGKVEVKKNAVNPPVMIFSIMPLKTKKEKKKKKESERRFLNVYIEFEDKVISHTVLSIIVQPKYFRLEIGPIHLNLSKRTAAIISFISIIIAGVSLVWTLFSWDPTSSFIDVLSGFAPGLGSIAFIAIFLIILFKEGIYPLKEKISAFLNFDQTGVLIK
ncbi:MAG: hypothetical protein JSV62_14015 [Promethearchaeota archaeon]|nr:MAG: hypothetical protein JSV62_14015 [Candidatus Lokiarchaeota archaeon]